MGLFAGQKFHFELNLWTIMVLVTYIKDIYIIIRNPQQPVCDTHCYDEYSIQGSSHVLYIYIWMNILYRPHRDVTGMIISKGHHPQMA